LGLVLPLKPCTLIMECGYASLYKVAFGP
jgi:hypothetical protein